MDFIFSGYCLQKKQHKNWSKGDFTKEIREEEELQQDILAYQEQKALNEKVQYKDKKFAFICTMGYFVTAYWALTRKKSFI